MKCLLCESFSLSHICNSCQELYLTPKIYKRKLSNGIEVVSFYKYDEIKELLFTKHTDLGFYIYQILAKNSFTKFTQNFKYDTKLTSIAVDDNVKNGYSHTAILNQALKSKNIEPIYNKLRATNHISYSGKSREFRMMNPRNFKLNSFDSKEVIVIDDIITTGSTLIQAIQALKQKDKKVLFCLTLVDVDNKKHS